MEHADAGQPKAKKKKTEKVVVPEKFKYLKLLHLWGKRTDFSG